MTKKMTLKRKITDQEKLMREIMDDNADMDALKIQGKRFRRKK